MVFSRSVKFTERRTKAYNLSDRVRANKDGWSKALKTIVISKRKSDHKLHLGSNSMRN